MPSFDVVSKLNVHELDNALNQARKEIGTRFDFRGTNTEIKEEGKLPGGGPAQLVLTSNGDGRIDAAWQVILERLAKRGVPVSAFEREDIESAGGMTYRQVVKVQVGIAQDKAKELVKMVKDSGLKVQAAIQGDTLRISGKKKDDLQSAIALVRGAVGKLGIALQFENFRD